MANSFTQNPIILDTTWNSGSMPAGVTDGTKSPAQFRKIVWVGATTAGHTVVFTDLAGNVILTETASNTPNADIVLWSEASGRPFTMKTAQWILSTLASGKVYLYK